MLHVKVTIIVAITSTKPSVTKYSSYKTCIMYRTLYVYMKICKLIIRSETYFKIWRKYCRYGKKNLFNQSEITVDELTVISD